MQHLLNALHCIFELNIKVVVSGWYGQTAMCKSKQLQVCLSSGVEDLST